MTSVLTSTASFNHDPAFREARELLAEKVKNTPKGWLDFRDSIQSDLVLNAQPGFVHPVLLNTAEAEGEGLLEVRLRALMHFESGKLQTLLNGEKPDSEYIFDVDQSATLMEFLDADQMVAVIRYAFSKRGEELEKKIGKMPRGVLQLQRRLELLETHCRTLMGMILGENNDAERE